MDTQSKILPASLYEPSVRYVQLECWLHHYLLNLCTVSVLNALRLLYFYHCSLIKAYELLTMIYTTYTS